MPQHGVDDGAPPSSYHRGVACTEVLCGVPHEHIPQTIYVVCGMYARGLHHTVPQYSQELVQSGVLLH